MMGNLFQTVRKMQKISQREIATLAGITPSALSQFETENGTLSTSALLKIAPLININPDFILNNSGNPFKSEKLIKMYLPGLTRLDFSMLHTLYEANSKIDFLAMHPDNPVHDKIFGQHSYGPAILAIAVEDQDRNLFLFRRTERRSDGGAIVGMLDFQKEVNEKTRKSSEKLVSFRTIKITRVLADNIKNGTAARENIEPLFLDVNNILPPERSKAEKNLLRTIQERGLRLEDVEPHKFAMALEILLEMQVKLREVFKDP